jgi:uncharacterized protein YgiM (DUF1202 family)
MINIKSFYLSLFIVFLCAVVIMPAPIALAQRMMVVQVREAQIRSTPSFLGKITARVRYGEKLTVMAEQKGWMKVKKNATANIEGWVHGSTLSTVKVILKSGDQATTGKASNQEVALAGKGFNEKIEGGYATNHQNLDYKWVDKMEQLAPNPEELEKFIVNGSLSIENGGNDE